MQSDPLMMDLAFIGDRKGRLFLYDDRLVFQAKRDEKVIRLSDIQRVSFEKKTFVTSTLFVDDLPITVCRAHLWAGKMYGLGVPLKYGTDS